MGMGMGMSYNDSSSQCVFSIEYHGSYQLDERTIWSVFDRHPSLPRFLPIAAELFLYVDTSFLSIVEEFVSYRIL